MWPPWNGHRHGTAAFRVDDHAAFGERGRGSVEDYAFVELDLPVRQTRDLIAIAKRLHHLPALAEAFAAGRLGYANRTSKKSVLDFFNSASPK
jgi:hypothetical protein